MSDAEHESVKMKVEEGMDDIYCKAKRMVIRKLNSVGRWIWCHMIRDEYWRNLKSKYQ